MKRYLLYIAYNGRSYSGVQLQSQKNQPHVKTVIGALQKAGKVLTNEEVLVKSSSRTDKGVSALCNTVTLDVQDRPEGPPLTATVITAKLNEHLFSAKEDIRILYTRRVPVTFHARHASSSRSYLYRLCIAKQPELGWRLPYPPQEHTVLWQIRANTDVERMHQAAEIMTGVHDFSWFTTEKLKQDPWRNPVKTIHAKLEPGNVALHDLMPYFKEHFDCWNVLITGSSFLYRQVRLMVTTLCEIGTGRTSLDELRHMLAEPMHYKAAHPDKLLRRITAPAYPLCLYNVHYNEDEFKFSCVEDAAEGEEYGPPSWLEKHSLDLHDLVVKTQQSSKIRSKYSANGPLLDIGSGS